jgi:hypothetical protein
MGNIPHYERACALARLGRLKEAISALERSVHLHADHLTYIEERGLRLAIVDSFAATKYHRIGAGEEWL